MRRTLHYNLPLFEGEDIPSVIVDWNSTVALLDAKLYELSIGNAGEEIVAEIEGIKERLNSLEISITDLQYEVFDINAYLSEVTTALGNIERAVNSKLDRLDENSFPVAPVDDEQTGLTITIPYIPKTGNTPPPALDSWCKWVAFYYASVNDVLLKVVMPNNDTYFLGMLESWKMYRGNLKSVRTYTDPDTQEELEFWVPNYVDVTPSSGSQYILPTASSTTLGGVKIGQGLSVYYDGTLSIDNNGSTYKMFSFESYLPANYGRNARKNNIASLLSIEFYDPHSSGISNLIQGEVSTNNLILSSVTPNECIQNGDTNYIFDSSKDRMALTPGAILAQIPLVSEGLAKDGKWFIKNNSDRVLNDKVYIYACFTDSNNNAVKYPCNICDIRLDDLTNTLMFQIGDVVCNGNVNVPNYMQIPNENTGVYFEVREDMYAAYWIKMITDNPLLQDMSTKTFSGVLEVMLWRFGYE